MQALNSMQGTLIREQGYFVPATRLPALHMVGFTGSNNMLKLTTAAHHYQAICACTFVLLLTSG